MNFKGFDDWIEIFRGGRQVDSRGRVHDGDALIEKAVRSFNVAEHEPPIVVGHPRLNAPAFGWVSALKSSVKDGRKALMARFRQVVPEFAAAVKDGRYKKRSAAFYPDGRLRHVGFLGAAPPAVKGLADIGFSADEDAVTFDFYDPGLGAIARVLRNLRDWLIEKEGKDAADSIIPDWTVSEIRAEAEKPEAEAGAPGFTDPATQTAGKTKEGAMTFREFFELIKFWKQVEADPDMELPVPAAAGKGKEDGMPKQFSEEDVKQAEQKAAEKAREEAEAAFAEKERKQKAAARKKEISDWCDAGVEKGRIAPAWIKAGMKEFMEGLDAEEEIAFSEEKKTTSLDWFRDFLDGLPRLVEFAEIAGRDRDVKGGSAAEKLDSLTRKKMADNKDLDYGAAFSEVQKENPELAAEYLAEFKEVK